MSIKVKSPALKYLEKIMGGPLTFARLMWSQRMCEEMSQEDFAKLLGVSKSHLCDIEKGRKSVSPKRAASFAKKLGYPEGLFIRLSIDAMLIHDGLKYKVELIAA